MEGRLRPRIGGECHGGVANLDGPHFIGRSIDQRVPERSAVGEEQLLQPVLTLWSHRESVHPPDGARPQHHFERRSGHMIAFVDEDHSVAGQRCHQVFHANQRRQHGNVESSSEPRRRPAPEADLLSLQSEKSHGGVPPLLHQHRTVHQHERRGAGACNQRAAHDRLSRPRRCAQHSVVFREHLTHRLFLAIPQLTLKFPRHAGAGIPRILHDDRGTRRLQQ